MKPTLAAWLNARPITCGTWPDAPCTLDDESARSGRYVEDVIVLAEGQDQQRMHGLFERASERLHRYEIFPPQRMRAKICSSSDTIELGATIVQQIRIGPFAFEAAVRVTAVNGDDTERGRSASFEYTTLDGHPEQGIARFTVREVDARPPRVEFAIESWSVPGHWLTRLAAPFARWMQRRSTLQALRWFRDASISLDSE